MSTYKCSHSRNIVECCKDPVCQKECVLSRNVFCQEHVSTWLSCFRTAAIVIIALSRMHFLVRRWQHRHHTGSSAVLTRGFSESTLSSFHGRYTASCCSFCFHFFYSIFPAIVASYCIINNACNCFIYLVSTQNTVDVGANGCGLLVII